MPIVDLEQGHRCARSASTRALPSVIAEIGDPDSGQNSLGAVFGHDAIVDTIWAQSRTHPLETTQDGEA